MRNLAPLKDLLEAQNLYTQYKDPAARQESLKKLSSAVGSDKPLPILGESLDKVFDPETPLSDMVLNLVLVETKSNKKEG